MYVRKTNGAHHLPKRKCENCGDIWETDSRIEKYICIKCSHNFKFTKIEDVVKNNINFLPEWKNELKNY